MSSIHIIGGSGFFGKCFIESKNLFFLKKKIKIKKIILSSRSVQERQFKKNGIRIFFKKIDIKYANDIPATNYIIFAANSSLKKNYLKNLELQINNSILGLKNFLKIFKKTKFSNTKLLFTSSGAVYGANLKHLKIRENKKISTKSLKNFEKDKYFYALSKIKSEKLIKNFSKKYNRNCYIARCFAFIGKKLYLKEHFLIGNILYAILKKKKLTINLKYPELVNRSFMNSFDLVQSLSIILKFSKKKFDIFNVGSDEVFDISILLNFLNKKYNLKIENKKKFNNYIDYYIPNIDKLKKIKFFTNTSNFKKDFLDVLKYHKKNF